MKNKIDVLMMMAVLLGSLLVGQFAVADEKKLGDGLYASFKTSKGEIVVRLFYKQTPLTVVNFTGLAEGKIKAKQGTKPYYDGLTFHRVIDRFMIQGGCPDGTGRGGPGYRFRDEFVAGLRHNKPGILSMANAGRNTNGSQFFITHVATPHLDGGHTVFGGIEADDNDSFGVLDSIEQNDIIESVEILSSRD